MIRLVIFDLDGVIVSTDELHYLAWKTIADREGIPFDRKINNRLRGVSRKESLEIILSYSKKKYSEAEKETLMKQKNDIYVASLKELSSSDIFPGTREVLEQLKQLGVLTGLASSSKNARLILEKIALTKAFDCIVDGNMIAHSKPHPEVFKKAADILQIPYEKALVVEDAKSGIDGAKNANMLAVGIGDAGTYEKCDYKIDFLTELIPIIKFINMQANS